MTARRFNVRRVALAAAFAVGLQPVASWAVVTASGSYGVGPVAVPIGPGNTVQPFSALYIGSPGIGSLLVDGGSFLQLARLSFGVQGTGVGTGTISGAGTRVELVGDGRTNQQVQRLILGDWGQGSLTVNQGARLDTSGNQTPCLLALRYCDSFVGSAAGDTAVLNIDGDGTVVRTGQTLFVAQPGLATQALDGYVRGTPGGTTRGSVNVTNGAALITDRAQIAPNHWSTSATGQERNIGEVNVSGAGSRWTVVSGNVVNHVTGAVTMGEAYILTANDRNSLAKLNVTQGAVLELQGGSNAFNAINLTNGGGRTDALISGTGTKVLFTGANGVLQVGRRLGSAHLDVLDGAVVEGLYFMTVGRDGSFGTMVLDGVASRVSLTRFAEPALQGVNRSPAVHVGNNGTGVLTVSGGALLEVSGAGQAAGNSPHLSVAVGAASSGTLNIQGAGSRVEVRSASVLQGGGAGEAFGAYVAIGHAGGGTLNITDGGKLVLHSTVVSTDADRRGTTFNIGGGSDTTVGARGIATVRGTGSEVSLAGDERFVSIGRGASSFGQLTLAEGGTISTTTMNVGRTGAVGVLDMNAGRIELTGQFSATAAAPTSTGLGIGVSDGTGIVRMDNGSVINMVNLGSAGMGVTLGGSTNSPGGDGSLTMSGGSRIQMTTAPGLATFTIGRQGSGLLRMSGNSMLELGDGRLMIGRDAGSDGTLIATGGSVINAGRVGVGRFLPSNGADVDGGTATMVLNGATLNATDIIIGSNGFLGGTAGSINASTVTNYGIFSPGNSPGVFTINADYVAGAGSRLVLEVQADGSGGFDTDLVLFGAGRSLNLAALNVEFRFLGDTDPNAFQASGDFDIDTFLARHGGTAIDHSLMASTTFSARAEGYTFTSFSFTADGGAVFNAVPVPEPASWALMLAGAAWLLALRRRTAASASAASSARAH